MHALGEVAPHVLVKAQVIRSAVAGKLLELVGIVIIPHVAPELQQIRPYKRFLHSGAAQNVRRRKHGGRRRATLDKIPSPDETPTLNH